MLQSSDNSLRSEREREKEGRRDEEGIFELCIIADRYAVMDDLYTVEVLQSPFLEARAHGLQLALTCSEALSGEAMSRSGEVLMWTAASKCPARRAG